MRVYIIGNDGITLCRDPPAAVKEGEIVVASNEELHAAELSCGRQSRHCRTRSNNPTPSACQSRTR